jgi:hypothetical protein
MLRIPHVLDNRLAQGDEVVSLTRLPRFTPQKHFLVVISVRGSVNTKSILRLEGLGQFKKFIDFIGNRTSHEYLVITLVAVDTNVWYVVVCGPRVDSAANRNEYQLMDWC